MGWKPGSDQMNKQGNWWLQGLVHYDHLGEALLIHRVTGEVTVAAGQAPPVRPLSLRFIQRVPGPSFLYCSLLAIHIVPCAERTLALSVVAVASPSLASRLLAQCNIMIGH